MINTGASLCDALIGRYMSVGISTPSTVLYGARRAGRMSLLLLEEAIVLEAVVKMGCSVLEFGAQTCSDQKFWNAECKYSEFGITGMENPVEQCSRSTKQATYRTTQALLPTTRQASMSARNTMNDAQCDVSEQRSGTSFRVCTYRTSRTYRLAQPIHIVCYDSI